MVAGARRYGSAPTLRKKRDAGPCRFSSLTCGTTPGACRRLTTTGLTWWITTGVCIEVAPTSLTSKRSQHSAASPHCEPRTPSPNQRHKPQGLRRSCNYPCCPIFRKAWWQPPEEPLEKRLTVLALMLG